MYMYMYTNHSYKCTCTVCAITLLFLHVQCTCTCIVSSFCLWQAHASACTVPYCRKFWKELDLANCEFNVLIAIRQNTCTVISTILSHYTHAQ